jgi:hypothetical protein
MVPVSLDFPFGFLQRLFISYLRDHYFRYNIGKNVRLGRTYRRIKLLTPVNRRVTVHTVGTFCPAIGHK